jgi:hypothetical protein
MTREIAQVATVPRPVAPFGCGRPMVVLRPRARFYGVSRVEVAQQPSQPRPARKSRSSVLGILPPCLPYMPLACRRTAREASSSLPVRSHLGPDKTDVYLFNPTTKTRVTASCSEFVATAKCQLWGALGRSKYGNNCVVALCCANPLRSWKFHWHATGPAGGEGGIIPQRLVDFYYAVLYNTVSYARYIG